MLVIEHSKEISLLPLLSLVPTLPILLYLTHEYFDVFVYFMHVNLDKTFFHETRPVYTISGTHKSTNFPYLLTQNV